MLVNAVKAFDLNEVRRILKDDFEHVNDFTILVQPVWKETIFHFLAKSSNPKAPDILEVLLSRKEIVVYYLDELDLFGNSPLNLACTNSARMAKMILDVSDSYTDCVFTFGEDHDPNAKYTPLSLLMMYTGVCSKSEYDQTINLIRYILEYPKTKINQKILVNVRMRWYVRDYLSLAVALENAELVTMMLDRNIKVRTDRHFVDETIDLHIDIAALNGDLNMLRLLLRERFWVLYRLIDKDTLLQSCNNIEVFKFLFTIYVTLKSKTTISPKIFGSIGSFKFAYDAYPSKIRNLLTPFSELTRDLPTLFDMLEAKLYIEHIHKEFNIGY